MKKIIKLIVMLYLLGGTLNMALAGPASYGFGYDHSTVKIRRLAPTYNIEISALTAEYSNASELVFESGPNHLNPPYSGHVAFVEGLYGVTNWFAIANPYNAAGQPCTSLTTGQKTGNCNNYTPADYGYIRFNLASQTALGLDPTELANHKLHWAIHEFGHILGRAHDTVCIDTDSIMEISIDCTPLFWYLTAADKTWIDTRY